jgi:molybdenum cofactor guanylyltransferase
VSTLATPNWPKAYLGLRSLCLGVEVVESGLVKRFSQVAAFILAGGASSRMGADKALLQISGVPLLVRTAGIVRPLVKEVTVVGSPLRYAAIPLRAIPDQPVSEDTPNGPTHGPLAGIATALMQTSSPWNLILACDLPYLSKAWVAWLLARAVRSRAQAVVPRAAHGLEPLAAVYRRECAMPIAAMLARGVRKVTEAINELRPKIIDESAWRHLDHRGIVLKNMNTPEDYVEARSGAHKRGRTLSRYRAASGPEAANLSSPE